MSCLYKYKPINSKEDLKRVIEIAKGEIYFPNASELNDPMELFFANEYNLKQIGVKSRDELLKKTQVLSFSKVSDDFLLWVHYASSFRGVCFGYDIEDITKLIRGNESDAYLKPVEYVSGLNILHMVDLDYKNCMGRKLLQWSYEEEIRLVKNNKTVDYTKKLKLLPKEVILGSGCVKEHKELIAKLDRGLKISEIEPTDCLDSQKRYIENIKNKLDGISIDNGKYSENHF